MKLLWLILVIPALLISCVKKDTLAFKTGMRVTNGYCIGTVAYSNDYNTSLVDIKCNNGNTTLSNLDVHTKDWKEVK
jgi:hypothetical protein